MLDQILGWLVILLPVVLSTVFILIPDKAEDWKVHMRWRWGLALFCLLFSVTAWWQQHRATHQSIADRNSAMNDAADKAAKKVKDQDLPYFNSQTTLIQELGSKIERLQNLKNSPSPGAKPVHQAPRLPETPTRQSEGDDTHLSEIRAELIGKYLRSVSGTTGTIKIVTIGGASPDLAAQLQKQFGEIGKWNVQMLSIGVMASAGFTPKEHLYILSPDANSVAMREVLGALSAASITAATHPGIPTIGPMSMGVPDVTIVLQ
jgi:hypothetical protein